MALAVIPMQVHVASGIWTGHNGCLDSSGTGHEIQTLPKALYKKHLPAPYATDHSYWDDCCSNSRSFDRRLTLADYPVKGGFTFLLNFKALWIFRFHLACSVFLATLPLCDEIIDSLISLNRSLSQKEIESRSS